MGSEPLFFVCTWVPKGRMSAELTGAQRMSRGSNLVIFPTRLDNQVNNYSILISKFHDRKKI